MVLVLSQGVDATEIEINLHFKVGMEGRLQHSARCNDIDQSGSRKADDNILVKRWADNVFVC